MSVYKYTRCKLIPYANRPPYIYSSQTHAHINTLVLTNLYCSNFKFCFHFQKYINIYMYMVVHVHGCTCTWLPC